MNLKMLQNTDIQELNFDEGLIVDEKRKPSRLHKLRYFQWFKVRSIYFYILGSMFI